jgi:iron complex outermembrane receptor protein
MKGSYGGRCHAWRQGMWVATELGVAVFLASMGDAAAEPAAAAAEAASQLKKLSLEELMNLEVTTASKRPEKLSDVPSAIQVITQEEIRRSGASSIPEALRLAPNLQVAQVSSHEWAITARGFNNTTANKLLVMIDGRSVYTPLFAGVFWDVQDTLLADIDRIEVISGPGGALWGANAVNGIINIITRAAKDTPGLFLEGGGGNELRAFGGLRYGGQLTPELHYRVYGKFFDRDSTVFADGTDGENQWYMGQGGFRVDWDATNHNLVTLQGDLYDGRIEQLGPDDSTVTGGNILGRWTHTFSEESDFQLQVYYDRTRRRIPNLFGEDLDTYDLDWQHRFALGQRQIIVWGLGYRLNDDEVNNSPLLSFLPAQKTFQTYSAFVQDEIILVEDRLRLTLGSKFEHNDYTGFEVQPSGRLTWAPTERQTIWAAISRAVRTPSRIDRHFHFPSPPVPAGITNLAGGPDFDSEDLIAYELGYRVQPYSPLSFSIATFYNDYNDLRSLEPTGATTFVVENKLGGETYGVELSTTYQVNEWWRVRGGYTFLEKHLSPKPGSRDPNQGRGEGNDPEQQLLLRSSMNFPSHWGFDATVRYVDTLPAPHVPSYIGMDLRLGWSPIKDLELAVVGQNLLDNQHPEFGMAGTRQEIERSVYGKLTWRF